MIVSLHHPATKIIPKWCWSDYYGQLLPHDFHCAVGMVAVRCSHQRNSILNDLTCWMFGWRMNKQQQFLFFFLIQCFNYLKLIHHLTFQTISSRHKQILPYLSRKRRSVGGFPHTSFTADVITKITSDTSKNPSRLEKQNQKNQARHTSPIQKKLLQFGQS